MQGIVRQGRDGVRVAVHVVPRSARNMIVGIHGGALRIRLNAPPVGGAANDALIAIIAKVLGMPQRQVEIISGHTSRRKVVSISGLSRDVVERKLTERIMAQG